MQTATGGIPRYKRFDGPAVFRHGFRPFFFAAGLWALLALPIWLAALTGLIELPSSADPLAWHSHEMVFGFAAAAMVGFLLTAIPNWTGRLPLQGPSPMALFGLWLLGRIAMATSEVIGPEIAAVVDLSFLTAMIAVVMREIAGGRNWRNLPIPVALGVLFAANLVVHLETAGIINGGEVGQRLGIGVLILMICLIGGRIVPSFTRNWLVKREIDTLPAPFGAVDRLTLGLTVVAVILWVADGLQFVTGTALVAAGVANFVRLLRWRGYLTAAEPLVWSLHLGFIWVPVGLMLTGGSALLPELFPTSAGIHALTVGAIGSMILAVMTRATLGHSGRALAADRWTTAIYLGIAFAATARVLASMEIGFYDPLLWLSAAAWIAAFGIFTVRYGAILLSR